MSYYLTSSDGSFVVPVDYFSVRIGRGFRSFYQPWTDNVLTCVDLDGAPVADVTYNDATGVVHIPGV
ncbi:MAG TPA: hypothetical protein EYO33_14215 [Phycisphaerales bacterium]|jgi:hypothetical protein|nr:hypothetical protein [Phycisphaerales bacterium]